MTELMPHLIVEYSGNLEDRIDLRALVGVVHEAALATGAFDLRAIRTRAEKRDVYILADGDPDNAFVMVTVRILRGRDEQTRARIGEAIFAAVCGHLHTMSATSPLAISVEVQEIDAIAFARNTLRATTRAGDVGDV
jgi:5-carboxymethyl-2-hydroxymuconate isomerase